MIKSVVLIITIVIFYFGYRTTANPSKRIKQDKSFEVRQIRIPGTISVFRTNSKVIINTSCKVG